MEKEAESPAHLFRELGRVWARHREKVQAIADLHAATEAFRSLLEGEKALVHRCSLILHYIDKEIEVMQNLDRADRTDNIHPWINPHKLLLARQRSCQRGIALCTQGRMFVSSWTTHFGRVVPEMAHRFPHTNELDRFFEGLEHTFGKKHEEYSSGHAFTHYPSIEVGSEQVGHIEQAMQEILNRLHTVQHDLAVLEHDPKNQPLQELINEELQRLAPLIYVTSASVKKVV